MVRISRGVAAAVLFVWLGCVPTAAHAALLKQVSPTQPLPLVPPVNASTQPMPRAADELLQLQAGDVVRVAIWREAGLSGDFPVDERGYVTLPLLGIRRADASPWGALRDSLITAYRRELRAETILLTPLRRLYVLGAVLRPGIYMLDPTYGLEGAISLAGGAGPEGNLESVRILRDGKTIASRVSLTKSANAYAVRSGDQLFVDRRSWVDRNSALLLTSVLSIAGIVATLLTRR